MPSARPIGPSPSPRVAFTLAASAAIPSSSATIARMASRCGASFGSSAWIVTSTLPTW
jgi:hypothetical protein